MVLEIGCGENPITENTPDIKHTSVDIRMDAVPFPCVTVAGLTTALPFQDNSIDGIVAQHVIEHHSHRSLGDNADGGTLLEFLREVYRVLKPGGFFESMCPNFAFIAKEYIREGFRNSSYALQLMHWATGGQRNQWDYHYVLLDANILASWAVNAGFERGNINLLHPFDWFGLHIEFVK